MWRVASESAFRFALVANWTGCRMDGRCARRIGRSGSERTPTNRNRIKYRRIEEPREVDSVSLGDEPQEITVTVEGPGSAQIDTPVSLF